MLWLLCHKHTFNLLPRLHNHHLKLSHKPPLRESATCSKGCHGYYAFQQEPMLGCNSGWVEYASQVSTLFGGWAAERSWEKSLMPLGPRWKTWLSSTWLLWEWNEILISGVSRDAEHTVTCIIISISNLHYFFFPPNGSTNLIVILYYPGSTFFQFFHHHHHYYWNWLINC